MQDSPPRLSATLLSGMPAAWKWILVACSWTAMVSLCLEFGKTRSSWSGALCGPWGCTAPLEAVVSMHAIWLLTLFPLIIVTSRGQPGIYRWWCSLLGAIGLGGAVFLAAQLGMHSPPVPLGGKSSFFLQQWGLGVFGAVDVPIVPALILLPYCLWRSHLLPSSSRTD